MGETPGPTLKDASLVNKFRETAVSTRRPDAWRETWQQIPQEDRDRDPIEAIIKLGVSKRAGELTDDAIIDLADEYDELRQASGLDPSDESIDHQALVDLFLKEKGAGKKPGLLSRIEKRFFPPLSPADAQKRRDLLRVGVGLGLAAVTTMSSTHLIRNLPRRENPTTPESPVNLFEEFIKPLVEEAFRRRKERAREEGELNYYHRIDRELNEDQKRDPTRINFLLFMTGKHLRPGHDPVTHGANQIVSFNLKTKTVDLISITGDTRGPKAEKYLKSKGIENTAILSINSSFEIGKKYGGEENGSKLMRETFEEATGLSMDFQGVGTDGAVKDFINNVLVYKVSPGQVQGGLDVDVPIYLPIYKVDIDGVEYPDQEFTAGKRYFDGKDAVQFMKGQDWNGWRKNGLPHHRAQIIVGTITAAVTENFRNPFLAGLFGKRFVDFLKQQLEAGKLKLDFDLGETLNFGILKNPTMIGKPLGLDIKRGKSVFIADPVWGGQGTQMMTTEAQENSVISRDYKENPDFWFMGVPYNGDPYAEDLVTDYWGKEGGPRDVVKKLFNPF